MVLACLGGMVGTACVVGPAPGASGDGDGDGDSANPPLPGSGGSTALPTGGSDGVGTGGTGGGTVLCPHFDPNCNEPDPDPGPDPDPPADDDFVLLWQDDFNSFDTNRWRRHDHTFPENASYFSYDNVAIEDGKLVLRLTQKQNYDPGNPDDRPYLGAEVSTTELFHYVRITARIKFAKGQGIISSLFTYSDDAGYFWNEIDVEYLGYQEEQVQYNLITSNCMGCGADRSYAPYPDMIGVLPYEGFHDYQITWIPGQVSFSIDNLPRWSKSIANMTAEARVRMNVWPTSGLDPFAGTLDPAAIPTLAEYDWVRVEQYVGD